MPPPPPPFELLALRGVYCLKENISKRLHNHSFTNILFYLPSNSHQVCLRSCVGPSAKAWLLARPIILFFRLPLDVFSTTLHTRLGLSHLVVLRISHYIVTNLWILWGSTFFIVHMVGRGLPHIILCKMFLWPLRKMQDFMFCKNKPISFHHLPYNLHVVESTLFYQLMLSTHWQILSSLIVLELI
jgi:hypothetical protein